MAVARAPEETDEEQVAQAEWILRVQQNCDEYKRRQEESMLDDEQQQHGNDLEMDIIYQQQFEEVQQWAAEMVASGNQLSDEVMQAKIASVMGPFFDSDQKLPAMKK